MKTQKNLYISIYYIIISLSLMSFFSYSCTSPLPEDSLQDEDTLSVSYDFSNVFDIKYEDTSIDLDTVSDEIKQKFYHNENLYQKNLNSLFKEIVIEKYIKDISSTDHIDMEEAKRKAYSLLGFSFLGLNEIEKKDELFKKIFEQKKATLNLKRSLYPTVNLDTKDFPRIKEPPTDSNSSNPLQIVVYSSLSCLKCKTAYSWLKEILKDKDYKDRVEIVYKSLPLSDLDFLIQFEKGALCSYKQNHFIEYIDYIYDHLQELANLTPSKIMSSINTAHQEEFDTCIQQKDTQLEINIKEADTLGLYSIPSFFINNRLYPNISSLEDLKNILDNN